MLPERFSPEQFGCFASVIRQSNNGVSARAAAGLDCDHPATERIPLARRSDESRQHLPSMLCTSDLRDGSQNQRRLYAFCRLFDELTT